MPGQCLVPARAGVHTGHRDIVHGTIDGDCTGAVVYCTTRDRERSGRFGTSETPATFGQQQLKRRTAGC